VEILKFKKFTKEDVDLLNYIGESHDVYNFVFYVLYVGLQWPDWLYKYDDDADWFYASKWFDKKYYNTVLKNSRRFLVRIAKKILEYNEHEVEKFKLEHTLGVFDINYDDDDDYGYNYSRFRDIDNLAMVVDTQYAVK
jgi:hypothetical protein